MTIDQEELQGEGRLLVRPDSRTYQSATERQDISRFRHTYVERELQRSRLLGIVGAWVVGGVVEDSHICFHHQTLALAA